MIYGFDCLWPYDEARRDPVRAPAIVFAMLKKLAAIDDGFGRLAYQGGPPIASLAEPPPAWSVGFANDSYVTGFITPDLPTLSASTRFGGPDGVTSATLNGDADFVFDEPRQRRLLAELIEAWQPQLIEIETVRGNESLPWLRWAPIGGPVGTPHARPIHPDWDSKTELRSGELYEWSHHAPTVLAANAGRER